jgi:hypothetical protein
MLSGPVLNEHLYEKFHRLVFDHCSAPEGVVPTPMAWLSHDAQSCRQGSEANGSLAPAPAHSLKISGSQLLVGSTTGAGRTGAGPQ